MIEIALPDPDDFTNSALDPDAMITLMLARLTAPEHCRADIQQAFRALYLPVLSKATNDPRMVTALQPAIQRKQLQQGQILSDISDKLDNLAALPRETLELLASRFEIPTPHALTENELIRHLTLKAEEYRALKAEIDTIDESMRGLANMKAAAKDAITLLDFDEVEHLLSMVHTAELEVAAETAKLRAHTALMRGRADHAFTLLTAAADSFGAQDKTAPTRKRLEFAPLLFAHGLRYGSQGLALAIKMNRDALNTIAAARQPGLWGQGQNNLAIALQEQGKRTGGADGTALLEQAVAAYRAALTVYTQDQHPVDWAGAQNNLALALQEQGLRTSGQDGNALMEQAVAAYRAALTVYTQDQHPVDWAMTQNNLAIALKIQGARIGGADGTALLEQAVAAYRAALTVYTQEQHPVHWAMTQNNLANTLQTQGLRTSGTDSTALLEQAVAAFRAALTVHTQEQHPVDWAMTQNNLANTLQTQGLRTGDADGTALLAQAVAAFRAALTVHTQEQHPVQWAMTQENLAILYGVIAQKNGQDDPQTALQQALDHVEAALTVFDPDHMPYNYDKATRLRKNILAALAKINRAP